MYENRFGRFTAVDPLLASGKSANPQSFNRYIYVHNRPLLLTDPSGECPIMTGCEDYSGIVYTNGKGRFFKGPGEGLTEFRGDVTLVDDEDGRNYRVFNYGEGSNGGSGWYRVPEAREPPPLYLCCVGTLAIPNPAAIMDRWEGTKTGAYNFAVGIPNTPIDMPLSPFGKSLHDLGVPRFFEYREYGNRTQMLAGFETQLMLTAGSFAAGGAVRSTVGGTRGVTVIGETMSRVEAAASRIPGARALNNMPVFAGNKEQITSQMMAYNRRWFLDELRSGRTILDIGPDPARINPSIFYQMERRMMKNYYKLHPQTFKATGQ